MELINIKIFFISFIFLLLAGALWNFFMLSGTLYILKQKAILYTKHFYYYIIYGAFLSTLTDQGFRYAILNFPFLKDTWVKTGILVHLGFIGIPIVFLMIFHYCLASRILDFNDKEAFKIALILGVLTAPWPTFFSNL
jgi:hypothetical protein